MQTQPPVADYRHKDSNATMYTEAPTKKSCIKKAMADAMALINQACVRHQIQTQAVIQSEQDTGFQHTGDLTVLVAKLAEAQTSGLVA